MDYENNKTLRCSEKKQYADFNSQEYEKRYSRARHLMDKKSIDVLLITERLNYQYFSGHRSMQNPIDKIRPYVFILPKDREPIVVAPSFEQSQIEKTTYLKSENIYAVKELIGHAKLLIKVLRSAGYERATIGVECGREQYLGLSYNVFMNIVQGLPNVKFVDASEVILKTRVIKSQMEIAYTRKACEITAQALKGLFEKVHAGMTEEEIAKILRTRLCELGAEHITFLYVVSGPDKNSSGIIPIPTGRQIKNGETFSVDVGVSYKGYCSDIGRTAAVGYASEKLREFYRWVVELRNHCEDQLRPGKKPIDVINVCNSMVGDRGLEALHTGRIGHGIGLDSTEYPSIGDFEDITFEPGMILACNPNFISEHGFINAEDIWVITDKATELLSQPKAENDIPIVG